MTEIPKGATNATLGTLERPRNAVNETAPVHRISVHEQAQIDLIELEGLDPDSLDPERHYRLAPVNNSKILRRRKRQGYEPELIKEGGVRTVIAPEESPDGTIRFGDRILMSCPRALYEKRRQDNYRYSEGRLQSLPTTAKQKAQEAGVPTALEKQETSVTEEQLR